MPNRSNRYGLFRRIGLITLIILKIILLFLEIFKRYLDFS
jgi:hypothetical protein